MTTLNATESSTAQSEAFLQDLLRRSATDMPFRAKLLSDPRAALAEHTGKDQASLDVVFIENKADVTMVLPDPISTGAEVNDSDLDAVSGGTEAVAIFIASMAAGAALYNAYHEATKNG